MRKSGLKIDHELSDISPPEWAGDLEQVIVRGVGFSEVDFFHRASRTLIMTDLVQNLETDRLPLYMRIIARLNGVAAPNGKAPIYLRLAVRGRKHEAIQAAERLVRWRPERVIFCHGRWFDRDGADALRRSLNWLLAG